MSKTKANLRPVLGKWFLQLESGKVFCWISIKFILHPSCLEGHSPRILNKFCRRKILDFCRFFALAPNHKTKGTKKCSLPYFRVLWKKFLNSKTHKNISFYGAQKFDRFLPFCPVNAQKVFCCPAFYFPTKDIARPRGGGERGKEKFIWIHKSGIIFFLYREWIRNQ